MVERVQDLIHPDQVILPDYLPGNSYSDLIQPVWCSYALGARPSVVISPDGSISFQQEWLQTTDLAGHLNVLLGLAPSRNIVSGSDISSGDGSDRVSDESGYQNGDQSGDQNGDKNGDQNGGQNGDQSRAESGVEIRVNGPTVLGGVPDGSAVDREGQRKEHGGGQS
ncbi:unnamed protein product [Laminaria digitata]